MYGSYLLLTSLGFDGTELRYAKDRSAVGEGSLVTVLEGSLVRILLARKEFGHGASGCTEESRRLLSGTFSFRYQFLFHLGLLVPPSSELNESLQLNFCLQVVYPTLITQRPCIFLLHLYKV